MNKFLKRKQNFLKIANELAEQFYKKNKDYGDSYFNINKDGFPIDKILSKVDFYVQLRRKFSRLANFAERKLKDEKVKNSVNDETEEDTIRDIAIYCIMELIILKGGKHEKQN